VSATTVQMNEDRRLLRFGRGPVTLIENPSDTDQDGMPARIGKVLL
jgi:hypothetical protein